ncbi:uncharacterized protein LOC134546893 isoform X3 [Prinia subflava]|uniref:uncharacterized protein LOC134546893 isoform X3 n=1 Tax=Prinia subflava TaxID=208062 RepID=UPI002FE2D12E
MLTTGEVSGRGLPGRLRQARGARPERPQLRPSRDFGKLDPAMGRYEPPLTPRRSALGRSYASSGRQRGSRRECGHFEKKYSINSSGLSIFKKVVCDKASAMSCAEHDSRKAQTADTEFERGLINSLWNKEESQLRGMQRKLELTPFQEEFFIFHAGIIFPVNLEAVSGCTEPLCIPSSFFPGV